MNDYTILIMFNTLEHRRLARQVLEYQLSLGRKQPSPQLGPKAARPRETSRTFGGKVKGGGRRDQTDCFGGQQADRCV